MSKSKRYHFETTIFVRQEQFKLQFHWAILLSLVYYLKDATGKGYCSSSYEKSRYLKYSPQYLGLHVFLRFLERRDIKNVYPTVQ